MDVSTLPFNKHLGLRVRQSDDESVVVLKPCGHHLNHVGTVHAAVVFAVAEAASGHCLAVRFPHLVDLYVAVLRNSSVKYRRPSSAEGDLLASGTLSDESAAKLYKRLTTRGRATVDIEVSVTQNGIEILTGTFSWFVAAKEPPT